MTQVCPSCSAPVGEESTRCPACGEVLDPFKTLGQPQFHGAVTPPRPPKARPAAPDPAPPPPAGAAPAPPPRRVKPRPAPPPAPAPVAPAPVAPPAYYPPPAPHYAPPMPPPQATAPRGLRGAIIKMLGGHAGPTPPEPTPFPPQPPIYQHYPPPPVAPAPPPPAWGPQGYGAGGNVAPGYPPAQVPPGPPVHEPAPYVPPLPPVEEDDRTRMMGGADVARLKVPSRLFILQILNVDGEWHFLSTIPPGGLKIGKSEGHGRLPDLGTMADRHFRLSCEGTRLVVEDLGTVNGVFLRISRPVPLEDGSRFRVGSRVIDFRVAGTEAPGEPLVGADGERFWSLDVRPLATLEFVGIDGKPSMTFPITHPERTVLGREGKPGRPVDVNLPGDELVSGQHAAVRREAGRFLLEDLGSRNGTYLQIRGPSPIEEGEIMLVGRVPMRVIDGSGR